MERSRRKVVGLPILLFSYLHCDCLYVGEVGFGLACFQSYDRLGEAYLCNPLRRQVLVLPTVTVIDSNAFRNRYGMGFDSATNAYKIVHVVSSKNADRFVAEVYTFGTKSLWRRISSSILRHIFHINCIYAHGDMHWTNQLPYTSFFQCGLITSFNFEKEEFMLTPLPDFGYKPAGHEKFLLTALRGSLAVVHVVPEETHVEIWVMKDYENKVWCEEAIKEEQVRLGNGIGVEVALRLHAAFRLETAIRVAPVSILLLIKKIMSSSSNSASSLSKMPLASL
ncbi:hypothetical protein LWI29_009083 [Acer saccharum]|uniref:F-box associated beta-propeller type 3 domain-containing protein n=1 Tax=Acer saccharum TaxID=4024 RepID=A0AA39VQF3_ACESA|nr:hypothetical protein LWI29_009083 [Acer saccharum]